MRALSSMVAHLDSVTSLAVDQHGLYLISGSHDCSIRWLGQEYDHSCFEHTKKEHLHSKFDVWSELLGVFRSLESIPSQDLQTKGQSHSLLDRHNRFLAKF